MKWLNGLGLKIWLFWQTGSLKNKRKVRTKKIDDQEIDITCPHCQRKNQFAFQFNQLPLGIMTMATLCQHCKNMMAFAVYDRSILVVTAKADKEYRMDNIGQRLEHAHQCLLQALYKDGIIPGGSATIKAMRNELTPTKNPISIQEIESFIEELRIFDVRGEDLQ